MKLQASFHRSIAEIPAADWDALAADHGPCMSHRFLLLLEETGCVGSDTGWIPIHLLLRDEAGRAVAGLPLYAKEHSWGEYVFDWSWAHAWERLGIPYYPKLVSAIPMTPVQSGRLCVSPQLPSAQAAAQILRTVGELAEKIGASGWHLLFLPQAEAEVWQQAGLPLRSSCHFQWFNHGYGCFDDYLAQFTARSRKSLRRERRLVGEQGLRLQRILGSEADERHWHWMYRFYRQTCGLRGQSGYMSQQFFQRLGAEMPDETLLILASSADSGDDYVGGALCLYDEKTLYGRYWGAARDYDCLHFEACYYQGIEFCIERGLERFDPGAQGEHKIRRGFEPVMIHSAHWIAEPRLLSAVQDFCARERESLGSYMESCRRALPFRVGAQSGKSKSELG